MHLGGQVDATIRSKNITFVKSAGKKATPQIHKHTGRLRAAQLYKQPGRFYIDKPDYCWVVVLSTLSWFGDETLCIRPKTCSFRKCMAFVLFRFA